LSHRFLVKITLNSLNDMGYEIKLIIGQLNDKSFLEIARIDISKIGHGPLSKLILFAKQKEISPEFKDWKFLNDVRGVHLGLDSKSSELFDLGMDYADVEIWEGDEITKKDLYDDPLPAIPLLQVLSAINEELKEDQYRRFLLAKALLEEMSNDYWDDIYVVPFGH
jgi:hypothetical protein